MLRHGFTVLQLKRPKMADIKELRLLAQAAKINASLDVWLKFKDSLSDPSTILELLDRLETAEKERVIDKQRIADLMAELNRVGHDDVARDVMENIK